MELEDNNSNVKTNLDNKVSSSAGFSEANSMELNIQPDASIINVFSRLSYKPWYAIAEFVDNSTQSYLSHEAEMQQIEGFDKLVVDVKYDAETNSLTIKDNAYGMEIDRFKDAIILDSRNEYQSGRNEFGKGLKTAASWFGDVWHVTSTQYGSNNQYTATVDIPKLKELHLNNIQIKKEIVDSNIHGTTIRIEQVTKRITGSRTIGKIRELLSSMYRRDINNKNIEIRFNDEPISFEEYPVLKNYRDKTWRKYVDFIVNFNDHDYHVTGFVAIMDPGSFSKAGFALFRQDRVVVGGSDQNYKPNQIFGQAQSTKSHKLFGELNMDDFPVNQAKDGFIWDDGLEDSFIFKLKENISEYIAIAEKTIKARANEEIYSKNESEKIGRSVSESLANLSADESSDSKYLVDDNKNEKSKDSDTVENGNEKTDLEEYIETVLDDKKDDKILDPVREYNISLNNLKSIVLSVRWARKGDEFWIDYKEVVEGTGKFDVLINVDHPFFIPYSKEREFQIILEKFVLSFILSEIKAKMSSSDERISPYVIKNNMNTFLKKLAED